MVLRGDPQCNDVLRNLIQRGCVESVKYKNIIVILLVVRHSLLVLDLPHRVPLLRLEATIRRYLHEIIPKYVLTVLIASSFIFYYQLTKEKVRIAFFTITYVRIVKVST